VKAIHRKTLWIHTLFSFSVCALLGLIIWLKGDLPTIIIGAAIALYIFGNTVIHIKRDDYKQDTLIEYILIGSAVFIVLVSALR
jgi:hypothetical protein